MSNTLESLLQRMSEGSVTQGWGAVAVFARDKINMLLREEFINNFGRQRWLPLLTGRHRVISASGAVAELADIQLGTPQLSFETASLSDSRAVVRMDIVAGRYLSRQKGANVPAALLSSSNITHAQGFWLEMDIDLGMAIGEIDRRGRVVLDLSRAVGVRCNLAGDDQATNELLAELFQRQLARLTPDRSGFQVGTLNLKRYGPLAPVGFRLLTQAAPGARIKEALNYGDGAVVVFLRLRANIGDGRFPPTADFPYLIPSDTRSPGPFSATFVLAMSMRQYLLTHPLEALEDLQFPNGYHFGEKVRQPPADLAVFGSIEPTVNTVYIEPSAAVLRPGQSKQFTVRLGDGTRPATQNWRAVSLDSHTEQGHGTISGGRYTAPAPDQVGHDTLTVVISADYEAQGETRSVSTQVRVVYDSMSITPRLTSRVPQSVSAPIRLAASSLEGEAVTWSLLGPEQGELAVTVDGQALFSPAAHLGRTSIEAQEVEASGNERRQASLLLVSGQQLLGVQAAQTRSIRRSAGIQLQADASLLPGLPRRWRLLSGGGSVSASGLFSAPADGITASSVVLCEIVDHDIVLASGYCVMDMSELLEEEHWKELAQFTLRVKGGLDDERRGSLYANGYQQLELEVLVETMPVGDQHIPLNVRELASITIVENRDHQCVGPIDPQHQGMPETDGEDWRTWVQRNRFELAGPSQARGGQSRDVNPSVRIVPRYLHSRLGDNTAVTFYALFWRSDNDSYPRSTEYGELHGTVTVTSQAIPAFSPEYYKFERKRVDGGGDPSAPDDDDFDYHLRTVDYWTLRYSPPSLNSVRFETLEFVTEGALDEINRSMVAWESEALWEQMFSWTGYIFDDPQSTTDDSADVQFDDDLEKLVKGSEESNDERNFPIKIDRNFFQPGTLVITLHRSDRVAYVPANSSEQSGPLSPVRDKLSKPLMVVLRDRQGNVHKRRISFDAPANLGHRNRLNHVEFDRYVDSLGVPRS